MTTLSDTERAVLEAYKQGDRDDPEGVYAPYHHAVAAAANGNPDVAYAICKSLKKHGLITCGSARQTAGLLNAPSYWITDEGKSA